LTLQSEFDEFRIGSADRTEALDKKLNTLRLQLVKKESPAAEKAAGLARQADEARLLLEAERERRSQAESGAARTLTELHRHAFHILFFVVFLSVHPCVLNRASDRRVVAAVRPRWRSNAHKWRR
jgi:hypothetical protein